MLTPAQPTFSAKGFVKVLVVDARTALPHARNGIAIYSSSLSQNRIYSVKFTRLRPRVLLFTERKGINLDRANFRKLILKSSRSQLLAVSVSSLILSIVASLFHRLRLCAVRNPLGTVRISQLLISHAAHRIINYSHSPCSTSAR